MSKSLSFQKTTEKQETIQCLINNVERCCNERGFCIENGQQLNAVFSQRRRKHNYSSLTDFKTNTTPRATKGKNKYFIFAVVATGNGSSILSFKSPYITTRHQRTTTSETRWLSLWNTSSLQFSFDSSISRSVLCGIVCTAIAQEEQHLLYRNGEILLSAEKRFLSIDSSQFKDLYFSIYFCTLSQAGIKLQHNLNASYTG